MGKPTGTPTHGERLSRAERERLMLQAAGEAFAEHGFHASSMEEIARASGISKPMLYRYFGSKEGLYAAYLQITGNDLIDRVRAPETRGRPPRERLRAGLYAFLTYVEEHRAGWTVLHGEPATPADAQVARQVAELRGHIIRMLTTVFGDEARAYAFAGAAESLATWWVNQPGRSVEAAAEILLQMAEGPRGPIAEGDGRA